MAKRKYYFDCGEGGKRDEFRRNQGYEDSDIETGKMNEDLLDSFGRIWFRDYRRVRRLRKGNLIDHLKCQPRIFDTGEVIHGHESVQAFYDFVTKFTGHSIVASIEAAADAELSKPKKERVIKLPYHETCWVGGPRPVHWASLCSELASLVKLKTECLCDVPAIAGGFINFLANAQSLYPPSIHSPTEILFPLRAGGHSAVIERVHEKYRESGFVQILHALIGHGASVGILHEPGAVLSIFWVEELDQEIFRLNKFPNGQAMHTCTDAEVVRIFSHLTAYVGTECAGFSSGWFEPPEHREGVYYPYKGDDYCPLKKIEFVCRDNGDHFPCWRYSAETDEFPLERQDSK